MGRKVIHFSSVVTEELSSLTTSTISNSGPQEQQRTQHTHIQLQKGIHCSCMYRKIIYQGLNCTPMKKKYVKFFYYLLPGEMRPPSGNVNISSQKGNSVIPSNNITLEYAKRIFKRNEHGLNFILCALTESSSFVYGYIF